MKMANMDHVFDYMFTNPKDFHGVRASLIFKQLCFVRVEKVEGMENP